MGCITSRAQEKASTAVSADPLEVMQHAISPTATFHFDLSKLKISGGWYFVLVHLVIAPDGHVRSAHAVDEEEEIRSTAERIELGRSYKDHVDFPAVKSLSGVSITLERTNCNGGYSIRISGKGRVTFEGRGMFGSETHTASIPKKGIRDLLSLARKADYFSLESNYDGDWVDPHSTTTTVISIDGKTKSVEDSEGSAAGMPDIVGKLEDAIDEAAAKGWRDSYSGAGCR
jgi:hypothetical protein